MKQITILLILILSVCTSCKQLQKSTAFEQINIDKIAKKGKEDVLRLKNKSTKLFLDVDSEKLKLAKPNYNLRASVALASKSFLTSSINSKTLESYYAKSNTYVVPFMLNNEVVAVAEMKLNKSGWQITELNNILHKKNLSFLFQTTDNISQVKTLKSKDNLNYTLTDRPYILIIPGSYKIVYYTLPQLIVKKGNTKIKTYGYSDIEKNKEALTKAGINTEFINIKPNFYLYDGETSVKIQKITTKVLNQLGK